jgi:hypothetical protein
VCQGCERCLTPTAWRHFLLLKEAHQARGKLNLVIEYLKQQEEEKLQPPKRDPLLLQVVVEGETP